MLFELGLLLLCTLMMAAKYFLGDAAVIVFCGVGLFCVLCASVCFWAEQFGKVVKTKGCNQ